MCPPTSGFLGEGDMVTQAIHDAQLLLRSHSSSAGGRERDRDRERDGGGKMVSGGRVSFSSVFCFFDHSLARLEMTQKFQLCHCENENGTDPSTDSSRRDKLCLCLCGATGHSCVHL